MDKAEEPIPQEVPQEEKSPHEIAVESQPHDAHGHFAPKPQQTSESNPLASSDPSVTSAFKHLLTPSISRTNNEDTLIDVHVNNPLKKIVDLLQDIKHQKAFSFTFKGSLGIMGVVLALSAFGIFGGSKMLCDKGIQTQVGMLKELNSTTLEKSTIPLLGTILDYYQNPTISNPQTLKKRMVLLKDDHSTIYLPYVKEVSYDNYFNYLNQQIYITGQYDICSQTLKPQSPSDIQLFQ